MHVDMASFARILERNTAFRQFEMIEELAKAIHETWRQLSQKEGWKLQPPFDMPYAELGNTGKDENRTAARRMPEVLGLAGLALEKAPSSAADVRSEEALVIEHIEHHLERLAEGEHDGWMAFRLNNGWRWSERGDDAKKLHPALVPFAKLPESDKEKDRNSVRHYPKMAKLAACRIVYLGAIVAPPSVP